MPGEMAHKTRKSPHHLAVALARYAARTRETNVQIARRLDVTEGAVRLWRKNGRCPKNRLVRNALRKLLGMEPEKGFAENGRGGGRGA